MAVNPIQASELIDDSAIQSLERLSVTLENVSSNIELLKKAIQSSAQGMSVQIQQTNIDSQALSDMEKKVESLRQALDATNKLQDENTKALDRSTDALSRAKRGVERFSKLTDSEKDSIKQLKDEIKYLNSVMDENLSEVNTASKSYNELSAMYTTLKNALNKLTSEERDNTNAGRSMTDAAKKIYEEMNRLQMQTGKFQMNVGNYKRAFDGLGYSITQVARELPSLAINVNTFFLAISNNIPMVWDEYKKFTTQQAELSEKMKELIDRGQEQSEAFEKLANQVMTFGQKMKNLITSFSFWISLLPTLLVFLPKIFDWVKKIFGKIEDVKNELNAAAVTGKVFLSALKKSDSVVTELNLIKNKLSEIKKGSDEWNTAIERVNELTHKNLSATKATVDEVNKVTDAYIEQAKQIAINQAILEKTTESDINKATRQLAYQAVGEGTIEQAANTIAGLIGIDIYDKKGNYTSKYEDLKDNITDIRKSSGNVGGFKILKAVAKDMLGDRKAWETLGEEITEEKKKTARIIVNTINKALPIMDDEAYAQLESLYHIEEDPNKKGTKNGKKARTYVEKRVYLLRRQAMEYDANMANTTYERQIELNRAKQDQEAFDLLKAYEEEYDKILFNDKHGFNGKLTEKWEDADDGIILVSKKGLEQLTELEENYFKSIESLDNKYKLSRQEINNRWVEKYSKDKTKETKADIESIKTKTDYYMEATQKRIKTSTEEQKNNEVVNRNIEKLNAKLKELNDLKNSKPTTDDGIALLDAEIKKTTEDIEKMNQKLSWSKQIANYKGLGDLMGAEGVLEGLAGGDKAGFLSALGLDMSGASPDQVDSVFDEWMNNASEAMVKWKDITIDSLGQILDAYVDFYQARADAAAEDTDKAKEAYELQKSLLEQGYANSVSTAWAEYQEKQALQKKAEEDAKNAEKVQKAADSASTASNLIVASSNILKQFAANPILAGILLSTMWGSFAAAKVMAFKASKYEEGGYEELTGGSHASGHDINLGVMNGKGRSMVAEGGESIGIFSRKAKRKYGSQTIADIVNSINNGTYEKTTTDRLNDNVAISVKPYRSASVNLTRIENTLDSIDRNGKSSSYVDGNGNRVVTNGNAKTTYIKR